MVTVHDKIAGVDRKSLILTSCPASIWCPFRKPRENTSMACSGPACSAPSSRNSPSYGASTGPPQRHAMRRESILNYRDIDRFHPRGTDSALPSTRLRLQLLFRQCQDHAEQARELPLQLFARGEP